MLQLIEPMGAGESFGTLQGGPAAGKYTTLAGGGGSRAECDTHTSYAYPLLLINPSLNCSRILKGSTFEVFATVAADAYA
jgi:hypothetical protein